MNTYKEVQNLPSSPITLSTLKILSKSVHKFFIYPAHVDTCISGGVWCSGNALVLINADALHRARLVLGWVTAFR